jgi:hypothetical protein
MMLAKKCAGRVPKRILSAGLEKKKENGDAGGGGGKSSENQSPEQQSSETLNVRVELAENVLLADGEALDGGFKFFRGGLQAAFGLYSGSGEGTESDNGFRERVANLREIAAQLFGVGLLLGDAGQSAGQLRQGSDGVFGGIRGFVLSVVPLVSGGLIVHAEAILPENYNGAEGNVRLGRNMLYHF